MSEENELGAILGPDATDALWKLITSLSLAGIIGVFTLLWSLNAKLSVMEATMVTEGELRQTIQQNVPPQWFREEVARIRETLENHVAEDTKGR